MNENKDYEQILLDFIQRPNYQPLKLRVIAKKLELLDEEKQLKRALKKLIKQKQVAFGVKHLVRPLTVAAPPVDASLPSKSKLTTSESSNEIIGVFRRNAAGFGFVTPQASTATDRSDDIFIPAQKTIDAADLDLVRVRLSRGHRRGRGGFDTAKLSGHIIEVIERSTNRFVGTYSERGGLGIVVVDAGVFETGIFVGDAGAKNCRVGDKVVIEMVRFPSSYQEGEAVIVEILGDRGKAGVDTLTVIRQFDLPEEFPETVLENARQQATLFDDTKTPAGRTDFTQRTVITIDPATARDFDDAISLEKLPNGHWLLGVHIADVSHFVPRKSDLDDEAYQRATSIYLPDRVIPMLPEIISNNLASLQPNRVRYTMTALLELNESGVPIHTELHRGAIKSSHRFTYEEIDEYLADDRPWQEKLTPQVFDLVRNMHTLAMTLRQRRMKAGAINLVLPEVRIDLDADGRVGGAHTEENTESHQVIEEFMLAANIAVAQWLADQELPLLRRVHANPSETKTAELTAFIHGLGVSKANLQDRFELKRIVEQSADSPQQHAIHYAVLRSMPKAVYSPEEIGHYALNAEIYCHFTSPIRRYPDLVIHRMVGSILDGKKPDANFQRLAQVGKHCSNQEKRAAEAERELVKLKLLNFMSDKIGQAMHARITGVEAFGVFAQGVEIPAEGLIPLTKLPDDTYQYDRATRTLSGHKRENQFRLGDLIEVEVVVVNPDRRILEFKLIGVAPSPRNIMRRGHRFESTQAGENIGEATEQVGAKKRASSSSKPVIGSSPPFNSRSLKKSNDGKSSQRFNRDEDHDPEFESDSDSDFDPNSSFDPEAFVRSATEKAGSSRDQRGPTKRPPRGQPSEGPVRGSAGFSKNPNSGRDRSRRTPADRTGSRPSKGRANSGRTDSRMGSDRIDSRSARPRNAQSSRPESRRPDSSGGAWRNSDSRRTKSDRPGSTRTGFPKQDAPRTDFRSNASSADSRTAYSRRKDSKPFDANRTDARRTDSGRGESQRSSSSRPNSSRPGSGQRSSRPTDSNRSEFRRSNSSDSSSSKSKRPDAPRTDFNAPRSSGSRRSGPKRIGAQQLKSSELGKAKPKGPRFDELESGETGFAARRGQAGFDSNSREGRSRTGKTGTKSRGPSNQGARGTSNQSERPKRTTRSGPSSSSSPGKGKAKKSKPANYRKRNPKKR
jgi:ribonuclease R